MRQFNRKSLHLPALILIILLLTGPSFANDYKAFESKDLGFSISYPPTWKALNPPKTLKSGVIIQQFVSPWGGKQDPYVESIGVLTKEYSFKLTLDQYYDSQITNSKKPKEILKSGRANINGNKARWVIYNDKTKRGKDARTIIYFFVKGNRSYLVMGRDAASDYPKHEKMFLKIINSFKIH